ncbi:MAG: hypothetical protein IKT56_04985 [Clostridia bacterium]|nr:hypothetical protein [Clostridia bacterium]
MKYISFKKIAKAALLCLLCVLCLASCGSANKKKINSANLNLDIGIGISHFDNESDFPAPSNEAKLSVFDSKIVIVGAYGDGVIETPLIYNNATTASPRKQLVVCGNRMFVIYCPDISLPNLQIASTDNGGETWLQSTLNFDPDEVGTIDNFTASFWSTAKGALIISNGIVDTFIYFTEDSGKTWTKAESAPPSQNWHDSLYRASFLSAEIGFVTYNYYSFPPAEPQVYITLDGSKSWNKLQIKVPASVMETYALAGTAFYDGEKINIPIELYNSESEIANTVYYVSYDFGATWKFYSESEESELELIRNNASESWFEDNRPAILADRDYFFSDFSLYSSFSIAENVRIDAYKLVAAYEIGDFSTLKLSGDVYFDENANLYYKDSTGFPILLFVYEGDVFKHTYSLLGVSSEQQYRIEGENYLANRLYEDWQKQSAIKTLFANACEAYSWFTGYTTNIYTEGTFEYKGERYDKVAIKDFTTVSQLSDYIATLFSSEIAEKLMSTTIGAKRTPLFIDGDDGLYRFGGYVGTLSYNYVETILNVTEITDEKAVLNVSADTEFYDEKLIFSYDCSIFRDTDSEWKLEFFVLPIIKAEQIISGFDITDPDNEDRTEETIYDIDDWSKLEYTVSGASQIKQFLEVFLQNNVQELSRLTAVSSEDIFLEYKKIDIIDYSISKVYSDGQSKIMFEYTIGIQQDNYSKRTSSGTHQLFVSVGEDGVHFTDASSSLSGAEKFLSDYFSSTLEYTMPDLNDLSYIQNYNITDFIIRRLGGITNLDNIVNYAQTVFGCYDFIPCGDLNESGSYSVVSRGTRGIGFDILSRNTLGDEITLTVQFFADLSKLIPARTVEYRLRQIGTEYEFISAYTIQTTNYRVYKIGS